MQIFYLFSAVGLASRVDIFMRLSSSSSSQNLLFLDQEPEPKPAQINTKSQILLVLVSRTVLSQERLRILEPNRTNLRFFLFLVLNL